MGVQRRPGRQGQESDGVFYDPNRDLAHIFPWVSERLFRYLSEEKWWPAVYDYLRANKVSEEDVGAVCLAFSKYVYSAKDPAIKTPHEALRAAGWYEVPEPARIAFCAQMGALMMGTFFGGFREAALGPVPSMEDDAIQNLIDTATETYDTLCKPLWRRVLRSFLRDLKSFVTLKNHRKA